MLTWLIELLDLVDWLCVVGFDGLARLVGLAGFAWLNPDQKRFNVSFYMATIHYFFLVNIELHVSML